MNLTRLEKAVVQRKFIRYCIKVLDGEALYRLPEKKRKIILMSYFLDMTEKEIAECMNLVQSTVHYHKADSLRLLKKLLE